MWPATAPLTVAALIGARPAPLVCRARLILQSAPRYHKTHMAFQWLEMRIQEERERRELQAKNLERLPGALREIHDSLADCIHAYTATFGADSAEIVLLPNQIEITVREEREAKWQVVSKVEVVGVPDMPGFRVQHGEYSLAVQFGVLPSNTLFYRDCGEDKYLTMEEVTRRILDRALFPSLPEQ